MKNVTLHQEKIKEVEAIVTRSGRLVSRQGNVHDGLMGRLEIGRLKVCFPNASQYEVMEDLSCS